MVRYSDEDLLQIEHRTTANAEVNAAVILPLIQDLRDSRRALRIAINTVECASIDLKTGEPLPWYAGAKAAIGESL